MERREFLTGLGGVLASIYFGSPYDSYAGGSREAKISKDKVEEVYLTVDDGPTSNMRKILDFLDKHPDNKVTFFVVGKNLQNEENMRLAVEAVRKGHSVGNHSYSHPEFSDLSYEKAVNEIKKGEQYVDWVYEGANRKNPKLFRFPYGDKGNKKNRGAIQKYLNENEYTSFNWNIDTLDWQYYDGKRSLESVLKRVSKASEGDIILSHDFNTKRKVSTPIKVMEYFIERGIKSKHLGSERFSHTYVELPIHEKSAEKSRNLVTVVESP